MTASALRERLATTGGDTQIAAWFDEHGLPTARDEAWHYTPVDAIAAQLDLVERSTAQPLDARLDLPLIDSLVGDHGGPRIVFVNGIHVPALSHRRPLPAGAWCGNHPNRPGDPAEAVRYDGFQALNDLGQTDTATVEVHGGVRLGAPIHIVHLTVPGDGVTLAQPRTSIRVDADASVTVIETYAGLAGATVTNAATDIHMGARARLTHQRIQSEPPDGLHVGHTAVALGPASQLRAVSVMLGAATARSALDVTIAGEAADAAVEGLYLPRGRQRHDNVVTVDHAASNAATRQHYKGVIGDDARGSFSGHVIVRPGTVGTDAHQTNRNLLLTPRAQADSRPWLEIFADDVACTHGATVGRLDDDALFYLRSRGIPQPDARRMLIDAFAAEIIDQLTPASLRDHVRDAVTHQTEADA